MAWFTRKKPSVSEPSGELGLSSSGDTGGPRDPQAGNIGGVARDTQGGPEDDSGKTQNADGSTPGNTAGSAASGGGPSGNVAALVDSDPVNVEQSGLYVFGTDGAERRWSLIWPMMSGRRTTSWGTMVAQTPS